MEKIKIFKNYGCLAAERRVIYTYGNEAGTATFSEEITVKVPDGWEMYETVSGEIACEAPWGIIYSVSELLCGNEQPCFSAYDGNGKLHCVQLDVVASKLN